MVSPFDVEEEKEKEGKAESNRKDNKSLWQQCIEQPDSAPSSNDDLSLHPAYIAFSIPLNTGPNIFWP
eukprot:scaffold62046_cov36-Cyclotella_meneghiniana.AAC.1